MKKITVILMVALLTQPYLDAEDSFNDFRTRSELIEPFSEKDFALGQELIQVIREEAKNRKPMFDRPQLFARSQPYRSGRLYYCSYSWTDRPLFASRQLWEPSNSDYKSSSFRKTLDLFQQYQLDGYASFVWPYNRMSKVLFDTAAAMQMDPDHFKMMFSIPFLSSNDRNIDDGTLNLILNSPYSFRWQSANVLASYVTDRDSPEKVLELVQNLEKRSDGKKILLVAQIHGYKIYQGWKGKKFAHPYDVYVEKGAVPASLLLHELDYVSKYLRASSGLDFGAIYYTSDLKVDADYYNNYAIPLYCAAIAQDEFNGKRFLANRFEVGYTSFHGSQTLSRDGTKTLRHFLEMGIKNNLDILIGTEWDELNEDTNIEPMVAKPMASQRIIKYYMSRLKKTVPTPNPGDDLSLPNLIISQRRQLPYGKTLDIELLNVPDSDQKQTYSVILELLDQNEKVVFQSEPISFKRTELKDHTINLPSENFAFCQLLQPRLKLDYAQQKTEICEGLPFTVMRTTACWDHTYFNTPLRNLLRATSSRIEFRETGKVLAPGVKELSLECSLQFNEKINAVEVVQDSHEIYAFDPQNEYLQNDQERRLYTLSISYVYDPIHVKITRRMINAPSTLTFNTPEDPMNKSFPNPTRKVEPVSAFSADDDKEFRVSAWVGRTLISVRKGEVGEAVIQVSGVRTRGPNKGQKFQWEIPLVELGEYGVKSKVFEDGLCLALETQYRPTILPLPVDNDQVSFKTLLAADQPNGILAVRAVSENGKVFWSKGYNVNKQLSSDTVQIQVYSEEKGYVHVTVAKNRVPEIKYDFTPNQGNILVTEAGREYYGHAGSYLSTAIAFEGLINSQYSIPACYKKYYKPDGINKSAPVWEKQEDETWALHFDGNHGNFLALPNTAVPHRAGFTMTFDLKPEIITNEQIIFAQYGVYHTGFRLSVINGKFKIEFKRWTPFDRKTRISLQEFISHVPIFAGKWQKVIFKYDEEKVTICANNQTESFPCSGISQWLTISSFGGTGRLGSEGETLYYNGLLRGLEIKHTASD